MHKYPKQIRPSVEIGFCDKPARYVLVTPENHVIAFCEDGHTIKGKIFETYEEAARIAGRLQRWINPIRCNCVANQFGIVVEPREDCLDHSWMKNVFTRN
jgi:hypothetical protein